MSVKQGVCVKSEMELKAEAFDKVLEMCNMICDKKVNDPHFNPVSFASSLSTKAHLTLTLTSLKTREYDKLNNK
jgi:hypothetical protein